MVKSAKVLAIIPARGGSKSLPRKNIKLLHGIPLIAYSIAAGLQAKLVNRVIVSTDDDEIAKIAHRFGAEVPFMRPGELAGDDTTDLPVFQHALTWLKKNENYVPDLIVQLRPTSPFRPPEFVDQAVGILLADKNADSVRTIVPSSQNPYKMWRFTKRGYMRSLLKAPMGIAEPYNRLRQQLPLTYWQVGHVDVIRYKTLIKSSTFFPRSIDSGKKNNDSKPSKQRDFKKVLDKGSMSGDRILPIILDPRYTIDIDTRADWSYAEWLLDHHKLSIVRPTHNEK